MSCHRPVTFGPYPRDVTRVLLPSLLALVLLAGGCGGDNAPSAADGPAESSPSASRSPDPKPSSPPASPSASASASASETSSSDPNRSPGDKGRSRGGGKMDPNPMPVARAGAARTHLLEADDVPSAGEDLSWAIRRTGPEGSRRVGACQRTALVDIGALDAVVRSFVGPEDSGLRSRQVVARFADPKSAWRAHQVLRSWHEDCAEVLDDPAEVGPMQRVELETGRGGHYRADHGPEKDVAHTGLGIVRHRHWLSVVAIRATKSDYPSAWTRKAVRRIAATF